MWCCQALALLARNTLDRGFGRDNEFGQKVSVATTNCSNWFVASLLCENNPYDGHTLTETLETVARVTGVAVTDAYVDKGYRGHGHFGEQSLRSGGDRTDLASRLEETLHHSGYVRHCLSLTSRP